MSDSARTPSRTPDPALVPAGTVFPFILVTSVFALWGFANDVTNPLVKAFQEIFLISTAQSSLVQTAFYGGYATMAIPAAIFIRRFSYKAGIVLGLGLYATGALLFIPASKAMVFGLFLVALYVLTFGLAFLETAANPYIMSMGPEQTATRRLNLAQAFNPMGSLLGMLVASQLVLPNLKVAGFRARELATHPDYARMLPADADRAVTQALHELAASQPQAHLAMRAHDLAVVRTPYVVIAMVVIAVMLVFVFTRMPGGGTHDTTLHLRETVGRLLARPRYVEGVVAQAFYVGAQIMCWTFIIHYAMTLLGMDAATAQRYNIFAMIIFCSSRFVCTFLLRHVNAGRLLAALALWGMALTLGTILLRGMPGLYCLVGVSACMSLMFPTIYGLALKGLGEEAKIGSAGLILAIVGGALMPPLQGRLIDMGPTSLGFMTLESVRVSFVLPLLCFVVIAVYGYRTYRLHDARAQESRT